MHGAEWFRVKGRELSPRQCASVTRPSSKVNPCQDHVNRPSLAPKFFQGMFKVVLAPLLYLDQMDLCF
jgi:hypothetical protein